MTTLNTTTATFLARLDAVERRLAAHAAAPPPGGLTDPDPGTGERWESGQVWAHLAEFPAYWMSEVRKVLSGWRGEPVPFGRVKSDPNRISSIERLRHVPAAEQFKQVSGDIAELRELLRSISPDQWSAEGRHSKLGVMDLAHVVDEFLVGHFEEHAEQLDGLGTV